MRTAALIALLPLLATATLASKGDIHNHHHRGQGHDHRSAHSAHRVRKSLAFGPKHNHATFDLLSIENSERWIEAAAGLPSATSTAINGDVKQKVDAKEVAKWFLAENYGKKHGEGFFIREDTYTDPRTQITHVYARQLLNGLEVSDGDMNLNIDRDGRILSVGNSFHPERSFTNGVAPGPAAFGSGPSGERERQCEVLQATLDSHRAELHRLKAAKHRGNEGAWDLVKAAAQMMLGSTSNPEQAETNGEDVDYESEIRKIHKEMRKVRNHIHALCDGPNAQVDVKAFSTRPGEEGLGLSPIEALVSLVPRISPSNPPPSFSAESLSITPHHSLTPKPAPAEPPTQVISGVALAQAGILNDVPARLMYTQVSDGGAPRLVWKLEVEMRDNWYESYVDVETGDILRIVDWASDSPIEHHEHHKAKGVKGPGQKPLPAPPTKLKPYTYQVFPWGINDPTTGNLSIVTDPADKVASPLGWHMFPKSANPWTTAHIPGTNTTGNMTTFFTTIGNNVIAHEDWEGQNSYILNYRPINESLVFVYDYGEPDGLAPKEYIDLVVTQLFYTSNAYHDLLYRLGFDEISGNFQVYNHGRGGKGGDPVIANAQDGSGYNNANFMTPPDGQPPRMRMYVWDTATPYRDGDLEAGIVIHEYSHGLSTRLTGGPANSGCLGYGEAGGMGEGWGDALATLIRQVEEHKAFINGTDVFSMGAWAANQESGIRNFKYSTNSTTNPSTYKTLDRPGYWGVHAIGEVWAEFLFVLSQRLVEKYGFSTTLFPPTNTSIPNDYYTKTQEQSVDSLGRPMPLVPKHGNTLAIQLIVDAMKLQPCRPSFFDARNAIIQADQILTGGDNACLIWKAFAERGLGSDAEIIGQTPWGGGIRTDGFKIPPKACKSASG